MKIPTLSRRQFALLAGASVVAKGAPVVDVTAAQIVERIQKNVGVPWRAETVDTFKAGSPDTKVTGIGTSFSATMDVMQRGVASGKNFFIVHEPTFYAGDDATKDITADPVYIAKTAYIEKHGLVVWRFHDHLHARRPDGVFTGMTEALGWEKFKNEGNPREFTMPSITLEALAFDIQKRMKIRAIRVIGDPQLKVSRVAMNPGYAAGRGLMRTLQRPEVDAMVIGESREWEGVEYARDAMTLGMKKGLIILGHAVSEDLGMNECARWLKTFVPEVPIEFIPTGEPFWMPKP